MIPVRTRVNNISSLKMIMQTLYGQVHIVNPKVLQKHLEWSLKTKELAGYLKLISKKLKERKNGTINLSNYTINKALAAKISIHKVKIVDSTYKEVKGMRFRYLIKLYLEVE